MDIPNNRREAAVLLIDKKLKEYHHKFKELCAEHGEVVAPKKKSEIISEVAEETFYNERTLTRYYNDYLKGRGKFCTRND